MNLETATKPIQNITMCPLADIVSRLSPAASVSLMDAQQAIVNMNNAVAHCVSPDSISQAILTIESLASLEIDHNDYDLQQQLFDEFRQSQGAQFPAHTTVSKAMRTKNALHSTLKLGKTPVTAQTIMDNHLLFLGSNATDCSSILRTSPDIIGGRRLRTPEMARMFPAPADIPALLEDIASLCDTAEVPSLQAAALAHARVLNVYPFKRANGKTARQVSQLTLVRHHKTFETLPPLSLALRSAPEGYGTGIASCLRASRTTGSNEVDLDPWFTFFGDSYKYAAEQAMSFIENVNLIYQAQQALVECRSDSAAWSIMMAIPAHPVFSVSSMTEITNRSFKRVSVSIELLERAGIVRQITAGRRNRIFTSDAIIDAYKTILA